MSRLTASDGVGIAYDDMAPANPDGARPMVLVHGFASNRNEMWRRTGWLGALERKGRRVVALDLRGHGDSDKPHDPARYGRARLAGDVIELLDRLGLGSVDVMGYSLGAHVALEVALSAPHRVANLILGGVGGRMLQQSSGGHGMAEAMEAADPETIAEPLLKSFRHFADEQGEDRLALAACTRAPYQPMDLSRLGALPCATLVVAGARDALGGDPQVLADAVPGARSVTLPGCDHFSAIPHALYKAAVFDWLDGWLE